MKTKEPKRYKVIMNPELERAIKGYKPEFGNREDVMIARGLGRLRLAMEKVDNEVLRGLKKNEDSLTSAMRDILNKERTLIGQITRRNLDF